MIPTNFDAMLSLVQNSGYFIILLLMIIEGPLVTIAASVAASLGVFNLGLIFLLSLLGDLIGDLVHYTIGRFGRKMFIERYEKKNWMKIDKIKRLENKLSNHFGKAMFLIKFTPVLTTPGLLLAGALKISAVKFAICSLIITIPRTLFFTFVGFYFGLAISVFLEYFRLGQYIVPVVIILIAVIYFGYKIIAEKLDKKYKAI